MTNKISKTQMEVLRRLATGETFRYSAGTYSSMAWFPKTQETVRVNTAIRLIDSGLVALSEGSAANGYNRSGQYTITDTGRALVEQEMAKEQP